MAEEKTYLDELEDENDIEAQKSIKLEYNNVSILDILIAVYEILDDVGIFAFKNWINGEIVQGPEISRYWIEIAAIYDYDEMPDPSASLRLTNKNFHVQFKKTKKEEAMDTSNPDYQAFDAGRKKAATETKDVWLVKIVVPRHFIDQKVYADMESDK